MYDKEIVLDILSHMIEATDKITHRSKDIKSIDDFLVDDNSLILLDSLCMQLIAIGEAVKQIDKLTDKNIFSHYPDTPWREIAGMRDILSHHYFDLNSEVVFEVITEHIEDLNGVLKTIHYNISHD